MIRILALALFIIPKLVIWPLIWFYRCRLKKSSAQEQEAEEETAVTPCNMER